MKLCLLGTGNAGGVPLFGCDCPACLRAKNRPKHQREPTCAMLETPQTRILLDAGLPQLGQHFPAGSIDTILLTHYHMDHVQGLFPIRWGTKINLPVIGPDDPQGCDDLFKHPGILDFSRKSVAFESFELGELLITPLPLQHSRPTLGYAIEHGGSTLVYLTDTFGLPTKTANWLVQHSIDLVVIDCSYPPSSGKQLNHNDLDSALNSIEQIQPKQALLTHISHRLDAWWIENPGVTLPANVSIGSDRQTIQL